MVRIILGILLAPWLYVLVWMLPLLGQSAFHKWVVINASFAYLVFLVLSGVAHIVLTQLSKTSIYSYCTVMFMVAALLDFTLSVSMLSYFESNFYAHTQVVENGSITAAGYLLQIRESVIHGGISSAAMAIFWLVAIWKPKNKPVQT
jgi:hypothetical protein